MALGLVSVLIFSILAACDTPTVKKKEPPKATAFVSVDINPSVELVVDQDNFVMSVNAANSDAAVLLWNENGLPGLKVDIAIEKIASLAVEMGYITDEIGTVAVTVVSESTDVEESIYNSISAKISQVFEKAEISGSVNQIADLVLSKEFEAVKAENEGKAGFDSTLTASKYRLVKSAMKADMKLTLDEAVTMTVEQLSEKVRTAQESAENKLGEAYQRAVDEAQFVYENAKQTVLDSAYAEVYIERGSLSSILLENYGAKYAAYTLAYRTIEHYYDQLAYYISNPIFSSDDVLAFAHAVGINTEDIEAFEAFKAEISNENGDITEENVKNYINKHYRNLDEDQRAAMEQAYDEIQSVLDSVRERAKVVSDECKLAINTALLGIDASKSVSTIEDIEGLLEALSAEIEELRIKLDEDMSEDEKGRLIIKQSKMSEEIQKFEIDMQVAVEQAKAKIQSEISLKKDTRLANKGK